MIKKIAVTGGVHGNELTGAYVVKKWEPPKFSDIEVTKILANPKAFKACRRYIDYDLNRSFHKEALNLDSHIYEYERAKVLNGRLKSFDFLIDLHTTTANLGATIVLSSTDEISTAVAKSAAVKSGAKIIRWLSNEEGAFINSVTDHSVTIEVGPVCQGVLDPTIYQRSLDVLNAVLETIEGKSFVDSGPVECYEIFGYVDYPRDVHGELEGMIHPELIGRDFSPIEKGEEIFLGFDSKSIRYDGDRAYALFINEAAYYEKSIAFCLARKITI